MSKQPLTRPSWWDSDIARGILRDRMVTTTVGLGDLQVHLSGEPLLRHDGSGGLLQSIRLRLQRNGVAAETEAPHITRVRVTTGGGTPVRSEILSGPGTDTRVLVPEVSAPIPLRIELPELQEGTWLDFEARPQRHWTLHLVQHSHLDIGYTDPQGQVMAESRAYLDSLLELCRDTDDWPEPARFRWAVEGFHSFQNWQANRPARQVANLLDRVREGRVELTAMPFNLHTETCSTDELHELIRPVTELRDRHGIDITTAMQTDVPGQVVGLPDVLADNGIRYLSVAHNWAGRAVPHLVGGEHLPRLFRWQAPSGNNVLVWRTDTPHGLAYMEGSILGFDESYDQVDDLLPAYLAALAKFPYPHEGRGIPGFPILDHAATADPYPWDVLHLRVLGKFADNGPPRRIIADTVRRWNEQWAYPQLRSSRNQDFFEDAEQRVGDRLETYRGDWSDWWVDGVGAGAVPLAATRRGQAALAEAQTVAGYAHLMGVPGSTTVTANAPAVYQAASLFNEHTWGAGDPWTHGDHGHGSGEKQWHWKYSQAMRAHDDAETLLDAASALLGEAFAAAADAVASFHIVNTCNWPRTETARLFLPESTVALGDAVHVLDARTGTPLPFTEKAQSNDRHRAAGRFLHVPVTDVPACGSLRLDIVPGTTPPPQDSDRVITSTDPTVLENDHLRVTVDLRQACIGSVIDKRTGRELVRQDAVIGFNGYVYDEYATAGAFNHQSSKTVADDSMHLLASRRTAPPAALVDRTTDATGHTLVYECAPAGTRRLRVKVHLPHDAARVDVENRIDKTATLTKESAFFAFPFALDNPVVHTEATGGVLGTDRETVPGSATHMRAIRRWISLSDDTHHAALATADAPLVQLGGIVIPYAPYPQSLPQEEPGTVFSWVHNNIWDTNFPAQQAFHHTFRYSIAITEAAENAAGLGDQLAARTAAVTSHPLVPVRARAETRAELPAQTRFLTVDHPQVRLVGLTVPSEGQLMIRLQSLADVPVTCRISTPLVVGTAFRTNYLGLTPHEIGLEPEGTVPVTVPALGTVAVVLHLDSSEG
ncbi:glycoside hydrolase family 38 C-terminal domain-containing protein [Streptomyces sp. IB201691-2A2]|uniref:glycoside hydrolase family 38 N-terminal domain-containing protein n=1 Tax=Streptomyces sp. IB201691-2A2 TaxID=2561920 RepID=UPI001180715F|nr:glycoside hydrolase family 38 C-terminal domain-containing protein [Streptomyces sp. IB201691-2A2]TRO57392.1 alpha-mannosidase [Streptomyces sp. IB201691-2A2]